MSNPPPTDETRPIIGIENRSPQEVFDIMAARIASILSRLEDKGWRTIDSAPKDGTKILACGGTYMEDWPPTPSPFVGVAIIEWDDFYSDEKDACPWQGERQAHDEYRWHRPTHWQPLPPPPVLEAMSNV